jgi:hypothetical protein
LLSPPTAAARPVMGSPAAETNPAGLVACAAWWMSFFAAEIGPAALVGADGTVPEFGVDRCEARQLSSLSSRLRSRARPSPQKMRARYGANKVLHAERSLRDGAKGAERLEQKR